eukprot:scaffold15059_cov146-Skeletonema_menzelii.AAC.18
MGGASAAASARQRKTTKKNTRSTGGSNFNSSSNSNSHSDHRLGASLSSLHGKTEGDIDASWQSRKGRLSTPKRVDHDLNSSFHSSGIGVELNESNEGEGIDMNNTPTQGQESFNENGDATSQSSSLKLPPWFHSLNNARKYVGEKVNDIRVQNSILLLIIINSIMMGIATFPFVKDNPGMNYTFDLVDQIFLIIFTIESGLQLLYHGWYLFKDGFLVFDLLIVIMSWALEGTQVIRAFRIFRALRLITRIEVMRNLVMALFSVIPKMTAIAMLLMLIFYIFSVMMTTLFKNMYPENLSQPYFESLFYSLFTLFQMMTLDEWADILSQVQEVYPWAWAPFLIFIVITGFVVVNLIIAVICDAVHVLGNEKKAGLYGYDSESLISKTDKPVVQATPSSQSTAAQRLEELHHQLDEMVKAQDQMRRTIEVLSSRLAFSLDARDGKVSQSEGEKDN